MAEVEGVRRTWRVDERLVGGEGMGTGAIARRVEVRFPAGSETGVASRGFQRVRGSPRRGGRTGDQMGGRVDG